MTKQLLKLTLALVLSTNSNAQDVEPKNKHYVAKNQNFADLGYGIADKQSIISAGYYHNWVLSKNKKVLRKIYIGTGIRFTGFFGKDVYFVSAPPSLYAIPANEDSLLGKTPAIYSVNAFINFGFNFTNKLQVGFDLDAVGFSFGPKGNPTFISNGVATKVDAKPTAFNVLLIGANDKGTLNGGLYIRYKLTEKTAIRATYHTLFTELTTSATVQTVPEKNNRFRHATNLFGIGVAYYF
jgi:hypothetical protein